MAAISLKKLRQTFEIVDTDPDRELFHVVSKAITMQGGRLVGLKRSAIICRVSSREPWVLRVFRRGGLCRVHILGQGWALAGESSRLKLFKNAGYVIEIYDLRDSSEDVIRYTYEHRPSTRTIRLLRMKESEYYVLQRKCSFSSDCDWRTFCKDDRCVSRDRRELCKRHTDGSQSAVPSFG